jgi:AraC-like DNA-binding protein
MSSPGLTLDDLAHLRRARDLIDREYARPLDVATIARAAHCSPAHFTRRYREAFGESPYQHLLTRRVERAKALLRAGELTVTEVCLAVGFSSLGSFSARFHEIVGTTPSTYRASVAATPRVPACAARGLTRPPRHTDAGSGSEKRMWLPDGSRTAQSRTP